MARSEIIRALKALTVKQSMDSSARSNPIDHVPGIVQRLYALVGELERHFPGRKFTPDGHLVGSLGEVLASYYYELEIPTASAERHVRRNP